MITVDEILVYSFIATLFLLVPVTLVNSAVLTMVLLGVFMVTGAYTLAIMAKKQWFNDRQRF